MRFSRKNWQPVAASWFLPALGVGLWFVSAVAGQARDLDLEAWSTVTTPNFTVSSDADPERAVEIARGLERFRAAFAELAPELDLRSPVPTRILAFRDAESFAPFRSGSDAGGALVLGQFLGHRDGNFITLNADSRYVGGFAVVLHEYVHDLVQYNLPGVPRWFNEGLAEYYSSFTVKGETAVLGLPVERHMRWLRTHELRLEDLLETTGKKNGLHSSESVGHFYAVSWGLVHYLLSSGDGRAGALADFLDRIAEGEAPTPAFEAAFDVRVEDLEDELMTYVLAPQLPSARIPVERLDASINVDLQSTRPADLLSVLGDLVLRMDLEARAERFYNLAFAYDPEHAEAHAGLAYLRDQQGRLEEAGFLYDQALELGPADARTYLQYGRHLLVRAQEARFGEPAEAQGDPEKRPDPDALVETARAAFRDAARLDPDFAEVDAMLGFSFLLPPGDPADGAAPLEEARRELPGRPDVVFHLVQLRARMGEFDRARRLVEGVLARTADEEMVYQAREEIDRAELIKAANEALNEGRFDAGLRFLDDAIAVTSDPDVRAGLLREVERIEGLLER